MTKRRRLLVSFVCLGAAFVLFRFAVSILPSSSMRQDNGFPLVVSQERLNVGDIWPNKDFDFLLPITNRSSEAITLADFKTSCACASVNSVPFVFAPMASLEAQFTLHMTSTQLSWVGDSQYARFHHVITPILTSSLQHPMPGSPWRISGRLRRLFINDVFGHFEIVKGSHEDAISSTLPLNFRVRTLAPTTNLKLQFDKVGPAVIKRLPEDDHFECMIEIPIKDLDVGEHALRGTATATIQEPSSFQDITLPCQLNLHVVGDLQVMPPQVSVGVAESATLQQFTFLIRSRSQRKFRPTTISVHRFSEKTSFEPTEIRIDDQESKSTHTIRLAGVVSGSGHCKAVIAVSVLFEDQDTPTDVPVPFTSYVLHASN